MTNVERLHALDLRLAELRKQYDAAAFEDRFADAERLDSRHRESDAERQRLRFALTPEEDIRYEVERQERVVKTNAKEMNHGD